MAEYSDLVDRITTATKSFARQSAAEGCGELIARLADENSPAPSAQMRKVLSALRNKRYFDLMEAVARALIASGQRDPQIRRQQAQGLIDQGKITAAIAVLDELVRDTAGDGRTPNASEYAEAKGLLGRANKQAYVNALNRPSLIDTGEEIHVNGPEYSERATAYSPYLQRAIDAYFEIYQSDVERYLWHGINTVACVCRARRDGLALARMPEPMPIASDILGVLDAIGKDKVAVWDRATAMEACVALQDMDKALDWLNVYINDHSADAFEFGSTLRQLTEVWQLTSGVDPGRQILPALRGALLTREGGAVQLSTGSSADATLLQEINGLQAILGDTRFVPLAWYRTGLERCKAVARIETKWGTGFGTGFLVRGGDLNPRFEGQVLLLTNAHVISDDPKVQSGIPPAQPPAGAVANFEARDGNGSVRCSINSVLWTSPPSALDATLLTLDPPQTCDAPYPLAVGAPVSTEERVYVIGHPGGRGLSLSMQDNRVVDSKKPKLHYRAPTEPGSSGSPVFNKDWELVALHHAGGKAMPSLSGRGTVEANEGIWISAIVEELTAKYPPPGT